MRYSDKNNNSKEQNKKNSRTSFSKEFTVKLDEVDRLTEKTYLE